MLTLARGLGADVITTDVDEDSVRKMGFEDVNIISLGGTVKMPPQAEFSCKSAKFFYNKRWGKPQTLRMRRLGRRQVSLQI